MSSSANRKVASMVAFQETKSRRATKKKMIMAISPNITEKKRHPRAVSSKTKIGCWAGWVVTVDPPAPLLTLI